MTKLTSTTLAVTTALAVAAIFTVAFAIAPLAVAASSGSNYPMEIIRAHTAYKSVDPATPVVIGLGVKGDR